MTADPQQALQLRDIHLPPVPPVWPPAPGWWIVGALLLVLAAWAGRLLWRRLRLRRQRRRVIAALAQLEGRLASERSPEDLALVSALLRRLALTRFPREQVAALSGAAWLRFLDESGGRGRFLEGPGRVLAAAPYQRSLPADLDIRGLVSLVREWLAVNTGSPA